MRSYSLIRPFAGTVAGVAGVISSTSPQLTFTRTTPGDAVPVAPGTPFIPTAGIAHRDAVNILNLGKNNFNVLGSDLDVIARTREAFEWFSPLVKRIIVMGHFVNRDTAAVSTTRDRILAVNAAFAATYGPLYFDLQAYVMSPQIWIDAGVTPTATDLDHQARGNKPPSLSSDDLHLTKVAGAGLAKALRRFFVALGWYKETAQ